MSLSADYLLKNPPPMAKKYNANRVHSRRSYTPDEIAVLFDINKKTVFRWIDKGMQVLQKNTKPLLIMGESIKAHLNGEKEKIVLEEDEFYCLKCKRAVIAKSGTDSISKTGYKIGKLGSDQYIRKGECERCGGKVQKFLKVSQNDYKIS
jgi:hypothetical protein